MSTFTVNPQVAAAACMACISGMALEINSGMKVSARFNVWVRGYEWGVHDQTGTVTRSGAIRYSKAQKRKALEEARAFCVANNFTHIIVSVDRALAKV